MKTTAIFGVGKMGGAILHGLLGSEAFSDEVFVVVRSAEKAAELADVYGVKNLSAELAAKSDVLILTAKPQNMESMVLEIAPFIKPDALVISVAVGLPTKYFEDRFPTGVSVVRVMPNTPSLIGQGMSVLSPGKNCTATALQKAVEVMACVGKTLVVEEELQNSVTAVSGSGPAYIFYVAEAMIKAGEELGLTKAVATDLTIQTIVGAALMLRDANEAPEVLRKNVTSPNGTTARAIAKFDEANLRQIFADAMKANHDRSKELSEG